jgi:hypothetical protein
VNAFPLLVFVAVALAVGYLVYVRAAARKRAEAFARVAGSMGFSYASDDPFPCTDLAFALLHEGDDQDSRNVLWGPCADGREARLFDFEYEIHHRGANGSRSTSTYRFSCCVTDLSARWPHLVAIEEGLLRGLRDALGFRDHQLESEEFNHRWKVSCDDPRFVHTLIDPRVMQFLIDRGQGCRYEVNGSLLLVATDRLDPDEYPALLAHSDELRALIPKVAWELYPS